MPSRKTYSYRPQGHVCSRIQGAAGAAVDGERQEWGQPHLPAEFSPSCGLRPSPPSPEPPGQFASEGIGPWLRRPLSPITCHPDCPFAVVVFVPFLGAVSLRKTLLGAERGKMRFNVLSSWDCPGERSDLEDRSGLCKVLGGPY